jgi:hypothetical protein
MPIKSREGRNAWFRKYYHAHPELREYHRKKQFEYYWRNKLKGEKDETKI